MKVRILFNYCLFIDYLLRFILFIGRTIVMTGLRSDSDIKKESFKKVGEYQDHGDDDHVRWEGKF